MVGPARTCAISLVLLDVVLREMLLLQLPRPVLPSLVAHPLFAEGANQRAGFPANYVESRAAGICDLTLGSASLVIPFVAVSFRFSSRYPPGAKTYKSVEARWIRPASSKLLWDTPSL